MTNSLRVTEVEVQVEGVGGISRKVNYLHYTHILPLKTETIKQLSKKNKIIVVEHNMTGQFAALLKGAGVRVDE